MRANQLDGLRFGDSGEGWQADARLGAGASLRTILPTVEADEGSGSDTVGNTTGTASTLAIGASTNGFINTAGDRDFYAITLVAGQSYSFTLNGTGLSDPYLELYNSAGNLIGFDDDFGTGINSLLRWTATQSGTYYLNAQAYPDSGLTGGYTLSAATSAPASPLDSIDYHFVMPTTSISIWFATTGYTNPSNDAVTRNWTQPEIDAVMAALATYSAVTPLTFSIAPTQGAATWIFSLALLEGNTLGYFSIGNNYAAFDPTVTDFNAGLVPGGSTWATIIHEAGHGLGMAHPHDNGGRPYGTNNSEVMQGVIDSFNSFGTFNLNQGVFTTMSYNDGWRTSGFGGTSSNVTGAQATPMALDVAFMQQLYGVNPNTGAGASTYTLAATNSAYRTIWDVSGTDTISFAGSGAATIDLRAATIQNEIGGGGYVSFVQGVHGGWTIANGVVIENATGGSGNDTLVGNSAANILTGGAGVDNMSGGAGNDTYFVDDGADVVTEALNEGTDTVNASVTYSLSANVENLVLLTSVFDAHGAGNALNNVITGNSTGNFLQGLGGDDTINGGGGADQLLGGANNDTLDGGAGVDTMDGGDGNDVIFYDAADDLANVLGGAGTDDLLVFSLSSAPTSFDLVSHGFERAEQRLTDSGSNPWATQLTLYDSLWRADFNRVVNDDGSYSEFDWDQQNSFSWATNWVQYDSLSRTDLTTTVFDSGVSAAYDYDQASTQSWVSNWNQYNASGALDINETVFDNGVTTSMDFDADNAFNWTSNWLQHDAGGLLDLNETVFDNGVTSSYDFDQADAFVWSSNWNQYAPGGALDINVTVFDDGTSNSNDFDQANAFSWTSNFNAYIVGGAIDYTITEYDNGETAVLDYDQANAFTWATIWQLYDSNGVLIGYQGVNDNGTLFGGP